MFSEKLIKDNEYYFFVANFFCTGIFVERIQNAIRIKDGRFYFLNHEYAYDEAYLKIEDIFSFATV